MQFLKDSSEYSFCVFAREISTSIASFLLFSKTFTWLAFFLLFLLLSFASNLKADSTRSWAAAQGYEATQDRITEILKKIDDEMYAEDETEGFKLHLSAGFWSPFHYDLFVGTLSRDNPLTIIRLEGDTGDVLTFSRIFEQEKLFLPGLTTIPSTQEGLNPRPLKEKYHSFSQGLNLVAPWLAVLHASWNSPRLTTGQTVFRFTAYLLFDGLMVWAGGTGLWQEPFNGKKYAGSIVAALMLPRAIGAYQHANLIRGHNRIARLGYTFYLD